ncbi:MAG: hypothetical protein HKM23_03975 [Nitrosopumilus sp.]|nr:hypothetical protein [Nitrosopumilus sp.]NNL58156.1 hypothetical protein [Nitrosopumilus sp.]
MNKFVLFSSLLAVSLLLSFSAGSAFAHPHVGQVLINGHTHDPQTQTFPLNDTMALEKSTILFHASTSNTLPWGFVEGNVANHVEGYPVIIQIFKDDSPVHFAQASVAEDGDYEYKFRVLNTDNGKTTKIFEGDYSVRIFKVVYLNQYSLEST